MIHMEVIQNSEPCTNSDTNLDFGTRPEEF
jgi:hypothetical protein